MHNIWYSLRGQFIIELRYKNLTIFSEEKENISFDSAIEFLISDIFKQREYIRQFGEHLTLFEEAWTHIDYFQILRHLKWLQESSFFEIIEIQVILRI